MEAAAWPGPRSRLVDKEASVGMTPGDWVLRLAEEQRYV